MISSRSRTLPRLLPLVAISAGSALLAAACGAPPGPSGWAGAQPVRIDGQNLILAAHRDRLYALEDDSSNAIWRFPARERDDYPLSEYARGLLLEALGEVDLPSDQRATVEARMSDLHLSGSTIDAAKQAVDATSADGDARSRLKSRLDAATRFERDAQSGLDAFYGDIGVSEDGRTAFVADFSGAVFALDTLTGHAHWVADVGDEIVGGVAVGGETIYLGTKGKDLLALDANSGERRWSFRTDGEVWATPTLVGDTLYATSFDGSVYALDLDGNERWEFRGADAGIGARPVIADGTVYVGSFDNKLYAIDAATGAERWHFSAGNWFWANAVVDQGVVYAASLDGKVYAVDAGSGELRWSFDAGAPVRSSPVLAGGGLVVAGRNGNVYKLDLGSGEPEVGPIEAGTRILADLRTAGGDVYVKPTSRTLYIIDAAGGLAATSIPLPD
ncbi:MAG: PQQ-binding-like beta-propeller repeat protein [Dehalococcoidia bacterium]